ncbi:hypothetical protein CspeluHIS016_0400300 [Cutaneotrichosporon spelunceum]|uniref:NADH-cytochrome b5 reductase n=1 Tax=Cutaneotrichosporon spelunceum TaxID=1672016 RepID=A0AAD3TVA6_9TREE|nr:hypothetical protein CspeluHIS016_0400300 [Cutaneotrichosporon spelunceum]
MPTSKDTPAPDAPSKDTHSKHAPSTCKDCKPNPSPNTPSIAHLVAPLPTHPEFEHDPLLPQALGEVPAPAGQPDPALRLRRTLAPIVEPAGGVLDPTVFRPLKLAGKSRLSHDTARYRLALPRDTDTLGLPIGQHVSLAATIDGRRVVRSYTPTSLDSERGYFDLIVKTYHHGLMSSYLDHLPIGGSVDVRGPKGQFNYTPALARHLLLVAGGSGITPMYRIIKSAALDPGDNTRMSLVFANVSEEDILLRNELDHLTTKSNGRLTIHYVLEHPPPGWTGGVGYVTREMLEERLPTGGPAGGKVLLCGPPGMTKVVKGALKDMGYYVPRRPSMLEDDIFVF